MTLPLIAEVLAGETLVTPGGTVDRVTACGHEPFLWDRWLADAAEPTDTRAPDEVVSASLEAPQTVR